MFCFNLLPLLLAVCLVIFFSILFSSLPFPCVNIFLCEISGHNYIGSEHLLLGLLREGEGVAARVLENLGADPSNIRTQVK